MRMFAIFRLKKQIKETSPQTNKENCFISKIDTYVITEVNIE